MLQDQYRAIMQYSVAKEGYNKEKIPTDWYCAKVRVCLCQSLLDELIQQIGIVYFQCGVFNFKRRENCFKCNASREESEKGGEGSDEVSSILTKSKFVSSSSID